MPLSVLETVAADAHDAGLVQVHMAFGVEIATDVVETVAADAHDAGFVRVHTAFGVEIATELLLMTLGLCRSAYRCLLWKPSQLMLVMLGMSVSLAVLWC